MIDKRLVLAVVLSVGFLLLWTWVLTPRLPPPSAGDPGVSPAGAPPSAAASPAATAIGSGAETARPEMSPASSPLMADVAGPAGAAKTTVMPDVPLDRTIGAAGEETTVVETALATVRLTNRGARVVSWTLNDYHDDTDRPLDLVSVAGRKLDHLPLQFLMPDAGDSRALKEALYQVTRRETTENGSAATVVTFRYSDGRGLAASKTLRLEHDSYVAAFEFAAAAGGRPVAPALVWGAGFAAHTGLENGQYADTVLAVFKDGDRVERRPLPGLVKDGPWGVEGRTTWAGIEDKYFAALFFPEQPTQGAARYEPLRLVEEGREHFHLALSLRLPAASRTRLFVGPKGYDVLERLGLQGLVDFGFFHVIALPLFKGLQFLQRYVGNYGWAIVILTVAIRLVFFPLMHKGQLKMRRMQEKMKRVQPRVKAMRERYRRLEKKEADKGNARGRQQLRQKMNEELMGIYREENINPLGTMSGCLPLLLQLPILYAFYSILTTAIELRRAPFVLWIRDLSQKDPYYVTPIIMGITMLVQQVMTSASIPDPAQRRIMYIMPVMFTYFFINLPSGLVLYWLVNNLLGIVQQYLINREADADARAVKAA